MGCCFQEVARLVMPDLIRHPGDKSLFHASLAAHVIARCPAPRGMPWQSQFVAHLSCRAESRHERSRTKGTPRRVAVLVFPLITLGTSFKRADREVCRAQYNGFLERSRRGSPSLTLTELNRRWTPASAGVTAPGRCVIFTLDIAVQPEDVLGKV